MAKPIIVNMRFQRFEKMKSLSCALLCILAVPFLGASAQAQTSDAAVNTLLGQVAAAYRNAPAFSATYKTQTINGPHETDTTTTLVLKKPGLARAEIKTALGVSHVLADGTTIYTDSARDKTTYITQPGTDTGSVVSALGRAGGLGVGLLPLLLTSDAAEKQIIPASVQSVKILPDATIGNDLCDVIQAVAGTGADSERLQFWVGKQDHLLRQVMLGPNSDTPKPTDVKTIETYSDVTLSPVVTDDTFKYVPLPGATATAAPKEAPMYDPRVKPGAAPFPITGKDLAGHPVSLAQFKGKVVLLDFWATWCGPCVGELPNVVAAYSKYHAQGFNIVGISLDNAGDKAKLTAFIKQHHMPWQQIYDGKQWQAANAVAYGVQAIPFTVLVGRDGKIAAVDARAESLAPAIKKALAQSVASK